MRLSDHPSGGFSPGTHEGVASGSGSPRVHGCYHDTERFRTAGAAVAVNGNRWYSVIVYGGGDGTGYIGYTPRKSRVVRRPRLLRFRRR